MRNNAEDSPPISGLAAFFSGSAHAWYYVVLLCILYALSFVDRLILSLIADAVSQELNLSDPEVGILLGAGFAFVYCAVGFPAAQWIDRSTNVKYIVIGGVILWSVCTILSAFTHNFETMLLARSGIAMGEAVLGPAAMALIARLFAREKRRLPTTIWAGVNTVMKSGALVLGAGAMDVAMHIQQAGVEASVWRITLVVVGVPGLLVAALMLATVRDPQRVRQDEAENTGSLREFVAYLKEHRRFWGPFYLANGIANIISYGAVSWIPTILVRSYDVSASMAGYVYGTGGLIAAITGVVVWSFLSRLFERDRFAGPVSALVVAVGLATVAVIASAFAPNPTLYVVAAVTIALGTSGVIVLMMLTIQLVGPREMVGRLVSINILVSNLVGLAGGPLLIAVVAGLWQDNPSALAWGLSLVGGVTGAVSVVIYVAIHRHYHRLHREHGAG